MINLQFYADYSDNKPEKQANKHLIENKG